MIPPLHHIKGYNLKLSGKPLPVSNTCRCRTGGRRGWPPALRQTTLGSQSRRPGQSGLVAIRGQAPAEVQFRSPGGGTVSAVNFGPRRRLQEVAITVDLKKPLRSSPGFRVPNSTRSTRRRSSSRLSPEAVALIRELPFRDAARPENLPPAVFVYLDNLEPFHPLPQVYLHGAARPSGLRISGPPRLAGAPAVVTACRDNAQALNGLKGHRAER